MKKSIWIINHYAGGMFFEKAGRHYSFAKYLKKNGYNPVVFAANTVHGQPERLIETDKLWVEKKAEEINTPFVFVKCSLYSGNGKKRIENMITFFHNVQRAAKEYAKAHGQPDVILASSVHPLTMVAGIHLSKHFGVKCICEVRDLWPASIIAYGIIKEKSILAKLLYSGEKWIYKKADKVIMTWPGGYEYIKDQGWERMIPSDKVCYISNGVDLAEFNECVNTHPYSNEEITNTNKMVFVYTGSIRKVNNLNILLQAVSELNNREFEGYVIYVFGDGNEKEELEQKAVDEGLYNIRFMGKISKYCVPSLLSQSDVNILHNSSSLLDKYGQSQNKLFEYLASGTPILMTYSVGYSIIKSEKCGLEISNQSPEEIADAIQRFCKMSTNEIESYKKNAAKCAERFDFCNLTKQLISVIEEI